MKNNNTTGLEIIDRKNIDNLINAAKRKGINPIDVLNKATREHQADKFIKETGNDLSKENKIKLKKILIDFQKFNNY